MRWFALLGVLGLVKTSFQMDSEQLELLITFENPNSVIIVSQEPPSLHMRSLQEYFIIWTNSEHLQSVIEAQNEFDTCNIILLDYQFVPQNMSIPPNIRVLVEDTVFEWIGKSKFQEQLYLVQKEGTSSDHVVLIHGQTLQRVKSWTKSGGVWNTKRYSSLNGSVIRLGYISTTPYFFLDENGRLVSFGFEKVVEGELITSSCSKISQKDFATKFGRFCRRAWPSRSNWYHHLMGTMARWKMVLGMD